MTNLTSSFLSLISSKIIYGQLTCNSRNRFWNSFLIGYFFYWIGALDIAWNSPWECSVSAPRHQSFTSEPLIDLPLFCSILASKSAAQSAGWGGGNAPRLGRLGMQRPSSSSAFFSSPRAAQSILIARERDWCCTSRLRSGPDPHYGGNLGEKVHEKALLRVTMRSNFLIGGFKFSHMGVRSTWPK